MATIKRRQQTPPREINRFLGINENPDAEYGLELGQATEMINYRITPQYQLKQRKGYKTIFSGLTGDIWGMWYGKLSGTYYFLFVNNGHIYSGNLDTGEKTDLGEISAGPVSFIEFGEKVYICGRGYFSFDGTNFSNVSGHVPLVAVATPPAGGGTDFEQPNLLTGDKHQTFSPDGTAKDFYVREQGLDRIVYVKINGELKVKDVDYTEDLVNGKISFTTAPTSGIPDNVDICWTKDLNTRSWITNCIFSMDYSGKTDNRIFVWGNPNFKNRRFWTGLANGVPSAEYFEAASYDDIGNGQYAITDIVKQYDRQKIYTEAGAYYSEYTTTDIDGVTVTNFPFYDLSEEVGNVAPGQVEIVNNKPFTLFNGVRSWEPSDVRDQTNQTLISQRVPSLAKVDLKTAHTVNWKEKNEYWVCVGSTVWIYNYLNDTWYKFNNIPATGFIVINGELYFSVSGAIKKFDNDVRNDDGTAISATWEMGFYDFDAEYLTKYMNNIWVSIKPEQRTSLDIQTVTNNEGTSVKQTIYYNLATYAHLNYAHFSYKTSYNPQPFYIEIQAMGFCYFKVILSSSTLNNVVTVLSVNLPARYGGRIR